MCYNHDSVLGEKKKKGMFERETKIDLLRSIFTIILSIKSDMLSNSTW